MKNIIVIIVFLTSSIFSQQALLSLQDAVSIGLRNSKNLQISESKVNFNKAKADESSALLLPQIKLYASYTRLSEVPSFQLNFPFLPAPVTLQEAIPNSYVLRLGLQQPLFTGFRLLSQKSMNNYYRESSEYEFSFEINEEAARIMIAYLNLYKALKIKALLENNYSLIGKHLENTNEYMKNGLANRSDVLKLEVQKSNINFRLIDAKNLVEINSSLLNKSMGRELNELTEIDTVISFNLSKSFVLDEIMDNALESRNDLKALRTKMTAASELINISKSGYFPNIYLSSSYYYNRPNQRIFPNKDQFDDTWDIGISLSWDLWNWGQTSAQVTQAKETYNQTEIFNKLMIETIKIEVLNNYLTFNSAIEKIKASEKGVESAKENYRIINEKYGVRLTTSTELIEAYNFLLQAETDYTNSFVDYEIARIKLEKSIGIKLY